MKKRVPIYHIICLAIAIITLFLPYIKSVPSYLKPYDDPQLIAEATYFKSGFEFIEATIIPVLAILLISGIMVGFRSRATAIVGIILSIILIIYVMLLGPGLTFSLFGRSTKQLSSGYALQLLNVITYTLFNIGYFAWIKSNCVPANKNQFDSEILDDTDILDSI